MATYVPPKRATALIFYTALVSQADTDIVQVNPTLATGDVKVSIDGGTLNNLTTLPVVTPAGSKMVKVSLSAAEMTGDNITVVFCDAAGNEWQDQVWNLQTSARQIDSLDTLGAGATAEVITVNDGTNPVDGAEVWMTTDVGGSNIVAAGETNALGQVTFMLDAGTYYAWVQLAAYSAVNPTTVVVT